MSIVGIQINKHYSHGKLYSIAIFQDAEDCCGNMDKNDMGMMRMHNCTPKEKKEHSCKNETEILKIDDVFISQKISIPESISVDLFIVSLLNNTEDNLFSRLISESIDYHFSPPPKKDLQAKLAVFLC